ncbi:MAG: mechanosensitive ion channel, partial [Gammaproteobacteria bacterium]|nr:mechanosensitive ion channel [Gammaproteobacteria bacterium]
IGVAIVMALQHVGIDITFVTRLLLILVAVVGGGLMLAFAIGARCHVANLLAHRELSRIAVGEYIRIDEVQGKVVEIHNTAVDIATAEGIATIPAARFAEVNVLRLSEDPGEYRSDE